MADFNAFAERAAGEAFYERASRLGSAFLSSLDSAMHDPGDREGSLAERIQRNVEQFSAALTASVDAIDDDTVAKTDAAPTPARLNFLRSMWKAVAEASGAETTTEGDPMTTMLKSRSAVVDEATELAKRSYPELAARSIRAARAKIWKEHPDLATRHAELPSEIPEAPPALRKPVLKGADALAKIDAEGAKLRKADPGLSEREARIRAVREHPELRDEYHRQFATR